MMAITAYQADDDTLHATPEAAEKADARHAYRKRVDDFVVRSPLVYEGARDLEAWLKTDEGYACARHLVGIE